MRELLPDVPRTIFRPSIVLGDSRRPETNQFDMVRAFVFLAGLPALPFRATDRIDIVPVDYVAGAIVETAPEGTNRRTRFIIFRRARAPRHFRQLTDALAKAQGKRGPVYVPSLEGPSSKMINALAGRAGKIGGLATLLKVFLPYLVWNTVFDNRRVVAEMGRAPAPFSQYCYPLLRFSRENNFRYKYRDLPASGVPEAAPQPRRRGGRCRADDGYGHRPRGLGERPDRAEQARMDAGRRRGVEARRKAEAAICGLQRHAQYRLGHSRRRKSCGRFGRF